MSRVPLARNPLRLAESLASGVLETSTCSELLMSSVPPVQGHSISHIQGIFASKIPLRTSSLAQWPETMSHLQCMHCGGQCSVGPPVPVAKQYEADVYWVFGPFCRPACAFGYICENDSTSKQLAATADLLRRFFGIKEIQIAPPRASHKRFGGPLDDTDFYGTSGYTCINTLQPPFVTYAHFVSAVNLAHKAEIHVLPQSAGKLIDLQRPTRRSEPIAEKRPTNQVPQILEFLATLKNISEVRDVMEAIDTKSKKRKAEEPSNFLQKYVKKTA